MPLAEVTEATPTTETPQGMVAISCELFATWLAKWGFKITEWGEPHTGERYANATFYTPTVMSPDVD